jgi:hypothetical protein
MKVPLLVLAILLAAAAACDGSAGVNPDGGGGACGSRGGTACPADQYCDFAGNRCGSDDVIGRCVPRPALCPRLLIPELTCGCDGRVYSSPCDATFAGVDLNESGACQIDAGAFVCGYRQCTRTTELCQRTGSDIAGEASTFTCRGLPAGCGTAPSCGCLAGEPCGDQCTGTAATGLTLTCPGG